MKKYRRRAGGRDNRGKIPRRRSIDERPAVVERRERIGDWEADLIVAQGGRGVALTLTERKSRFTLLRTFPSKHAEPITAGIINLLREDGRVKTITFAGHEQVAVALGAECFFAHPYASWERGTMKTPTA